MPYIPQEDRPSLDEKVDVLAEEISLKLEDKEPTFISVVYREAFKDMCNTIFFLVKCGSEQIYRMTKTRMYPLTKAEALAYQVFEEAGKYGYKEAWHGELNYAVTRLIQAVPSKMVEKGKWNESFRYWLYAQTVGALERTAIDISTLCNNDQVSNGLVGVFTDIKDEYKRRVNTAYEAAQIEKNGDCYDKSAFRTQLVKFDNGSVKGYIEVMLPKQD